MRARVFSTASAVIGFVATTVYADDLRDKVELNWVAPEPCPEKGEFLAGISRMLGNRITIDHTLLANVVITQPSGTSFQLKLTTELDGASGQRVLQGRVCKVVADAAAVTLALLLNPELEVPPETALNDEPANPPLSAASQLPPKNGTARELTSTPKQTHRSHWYGLASGQFGLQHGAMPRLNPQASLGVGVGLGHASVWTTGSFSPPQSVTLAPQNVGGRLWTASVGVYGCWFWTIHSPRLGNCLGAEVTRLQGRGTGVASARDGITYWISPGLAAFADFALYGRAWFRLAALGLLPLARPDTHLDDFGTVQKPAKAAERLDAGVVLDF